jgi:hypothetical protein
MMRQTVREVFAKGVKILVMGLLAVCPAGLAPASATTITSSMASELFRDANARFQAQDYAGAREKYSLLVGSGIRSADLFYNLGNTAARLNRPGEAVTFLRKALEFRPRDPDIRETLVRIAPGAVPNGSAYGRLVASLTLDEVLTWFFCAYFTMCIVGAALMYWRPPTASLRLFFWVTAACAVITGVIAGTKYYDAVRTQYAAVVQPSKQMRSGPGDKFVAIGPVAEGTVLRYLGAEGEEWVQVQLQDGRRGYLPKASLGLI